MQRKHFGMGLIRGQGFIRGWGLVKNFHFQSEGLFEGGAYKEIGISRFTVAG